MLIILTHLGLGDIFECSQYIVIVLLPIKYEYYDDFNARHFWPLGLLCQMNLSLSHNLFVSD